jgi:hypothetical protein
MCMASECVCVCVCVCVYVCMYVCMYCSVLWHTYIHTYRTEDKVSPGMWLNSLVNVYWLFIVSLKHIKRLHDVTSQKVVIFLVTIMRTSNVTRSRTICRVLLVTSKCMMSLTECIFVTSHIVVHADNVIFLSLSEDDNDWFPVNFLKD